MERGQDEISKLERRADLLVSTLRRHVEAMEGRLDIVAIFPDGEVRISNLGELARRLTFALCYSRIDGQKKSFDDATWLQKFTPRGKRRYGLAYRRAHDFRQEAERRWETPRRRTIFVLSNRPLPYM